MSARRLVAIVGPTASGKSALALALAKRFGGEIVNGDSRQVYRGMDIGTAKPAPAERARVPHHLFDICDPADDFSLALYQRAAIEACDGAWERGSVPFLVGGTGQYVWSVLENWRIPEVAPDEKFRAALEARAASIGAEALHAELAAVDPVAAARIDARNIRRVIRALEVFHHTGRPISEWQEKRPPEFAFLVLGVHVEPAELDLRIDTRVVAMFEAGFVAEVEALRAAGYGRELPSMSSIGYAQVHAFLDGECTLDEAITQAQRATRRLARRQAAWFRASDPRITWLSTLAEATSACEAFLPPPID